MFERFSDQARRAVVLAQEEARGLDHGYIGTEHLLLGLLKAPGAAASALNSSGIATEMARERITEMIGRGKKTQSGHIPFTPRAKKVLELALKESRELSDEMIMTGHLLLGILREGEGVAAQVITGAGVNPDALRGQVAALLEQEPREPGEPQIARTRVVRARPVRLAWENVMPVLDSIEARLDSIEQQLGIGSDGQAPEASQEPEDGESAG